MRSNSGKDESRDNLKDVRDREEAHSISGNEQGHSKAPADHRGGRKD